MRVSYIGASRSGGAGRAMERIRNAVEGSEGVSTSVYERSSAPGIMAQKAAVRVVLEYLGSKELGYQSLARINTGLGSEINRSKPDLVHLHWIGDDTISIREIAKLLPPVVWTLHDSWPFSGSLHIFGEGPPGRPNGVRRIKASISKSIDGYQKRQKALYWKNPIWLVSPSKWLAELARESPISRGWPVTSIPNPIDVDFWTPGNKFEARKQLGLPLGISLVVFFNAETKFGDVKGMADVAAICAGIVSGRDTTVSDLPLVIGNFGAPSISPALERDKGFSTISWGFVSDDHKLRTILRAADVLLVPSRADNFPSVVSEAMACGTPVAGYNAFGVGEMVTNDVDGVLADSFDAIALGERLGRFLRSDSLARFAEAARRKATDKWNMPTVANDYRELYSEWISRCALAGGKP